jgi:amino acid transporter
MGRDEEVPSHFGLLHGKTMSPHRAIWALALLSAILGIVTVAVYLGGTTPAALDKHNFWYSFGIFSPATYAKLPNTLVIITLISNFGTFLLYMMTCAIAIVAFKDHHSFNGFKHFFIPVFGLVANLLCMLFYLIGPFMVSGMSWKEPYIALLVAAGWGIYGLVYFKKRSTQLGRPIFLKEQTA